MLARYTVTLRADRARFPVLLAGGNPDGAGELPDGRHWARFVDPHPKPSYLFALVAGRLEKIERDYVTADGRDVKLVIWSEANVIDSCHYAMDSLERCMRWDEQTYGRNYDLDVFHVVATHDFNMGAMENKGLNIFNAKYLLADPDSTTDDEYKAVEAVVAHEYFHNWSGNRVTCRDWFQLSLKEGLTVFREQQFSADMNSVALKRIEDVALLRRAQFPEDAGPLAHPVRPAAYREINNFYTATVYEKGSELVRMLAGKLGTRRLPSRHGSLLRAQRRPRRHAGGFPRRAGRGQRHRPDALSGLVRPGRHAATAARSGQFDAARRDLHADPDPAHAGHRRAAGQAAAADPGQAGAVRPRRQPCCRCSSTAMAHGTETVVVLDAAEQVIRVHRRGARAGALAAARLLGAGDPGVRLRPGRSRPAADARSGRLQSLGGRPAAGRARVRRLPRRRR